MSGQERSAYAFATIDATQREPFSADGRKAIPATTIGGGVWLTPTLGIEGTVGVQSAQIFEWHFNAFNISQRYETTTRDLPLLGQIRYASRPTRSVGLDFLAGAGFDRLAARTVETADCSSLSACTPTPMARPQVTVFWEPAWVVALEVPFRVTSRVSVGPRFQVLNIQRGGALNGDQVRGPAPGSGVVLSWGRALSWSGR